jgi:hypothetical protein
VTLAVAEHLFFIKALKFAVQTLQFLVAHVLGVYKTIAGFLARLYELIEFQVYGLRIAVLGILDQEDH